MATLIKNASFVVRDLKEGDYDQFREMLSNPRAGLPMVLSATLQSERDIEFLFRDSIGQKSKPFDKRGYDSLVVELAQEGGGVIAFVDLIPQRDGSYTLTTYADSSGLTDYPVGRAIRSIADLLKQDHKARKVQTFIDDRDSNWIATFSDNGFKFEKAFKKKVVYSIDYD
jgi:hypothetical protein